MVTFPNCKINLGLHILQKRKDGFHNIETVFYPLPFYDALEIVASKNDSLLINTGIFTGNENDNLCWKAYQILKNDFPELEDVHIHLHKAIPLGAGLGGGSADAAFTLSLINEKWNLKIPGKTLAQYAARLGSDCAFFLKNTPSFAIGRGEIIEPVNLSLKGFKIILINPGITISTKEIFERVKPAVPLISIRKIIEEPIESWKETLKNDFEEIVFPDHREIKMIRDNFYNQGAVYASMTGTGSTVYAIFKSTDKPKFSIPGSYFYREMENLQ